MAAHSYTPPPPPHTSHPTDPLPSQQDTPDPHLFATEIRNCAASTVTLTLYSAKGATTRTLHVPVPSASPSLGLALQHAPLATTHEVWHILSTAASSPAETAGLLPHSDYIVGTPSGLVVRGESGLSELVEDHLARPLVLHVYNHEYDVTRLVTITPSRSWGGDGALGCTLGYGALHRLPRPLGEPVDGMGEVLFETAPAATMRGSVVSNSSDILVPATHLANAPPPPRTGGSPEGGRPAPAAGRARRTPQGAAGGVGGGMDDYFREGEAKSKELDGPGSTPKGAPPPPKRGGPPRAASVSEEAPGGEETDEKKGEGGE